jgi:hypothetical protein
MERGYASGRCNGRQERALLHREVGVVECLKIHVEQKKLEVTLSLIFEKFRKNR